MKKLFYLLLPLMSHICFGQSIIEDKCKTGRASSHIADLSANIRINIYKNEKFNALNQTDETKSLGCTAQNFLSFLNDSVSIKDSDGKHYYDGLRIYFAVDVNIKKLTVVLVPTKANKMDATVHDDDTTHCWVIKDDTIHRLIPGEAVVWTQEYIRTRLNLFENNGQKHTRPRQPFLETRSLWYDIKYLDNDEGNSIICFMERHPKIDQVFINFAGYPLFKRNDFWYHLTLVFDFYASTSKKEKHNYTFKFNLFDQGGSEGKTDTGDPCPPFPKGTHSCAGAKLSTF